MNKTLISLALTVISIPSVIIGCGDSAKEPEPKVGATADNVSQPNNPSTAATGAELGTTANANHFTVAMTSDPATPAVGEVRFLLVVNHHGEATADAKVHVQLSMPGMSMGGPEFEAKSLGGGRYEGTTTLPMAGEYQAAVHVSGDEGHTGTGTFRFEAKE